MRISDWSSDVCSSDLSSCKPGKESPMRNLAQWLDEYSASHRNPTNKLLHWICVPLIAFSIACALKVIPVGHGNFNAATFVGVVTLLYYFRLSWRLALGMTAIFLLAYWAVIEIGRAHV